MPWSEPALLAAAAAASAGVSAGLTAWARAHACRRGLLDRPGERRSHLVPTPRGGGIGIAVAGVMACAVLALQRHPAWLLVDAGLLLVAVVGWWDDHRPLPVWPRLVAHASAGLCLAAALQVQGAAPVSGLVAFLLAMVLVNAWNFIDGIDGLASTQALLWALALACLASGSARWLAVVIAGASAGFVPFNFPKARIFLGDVGSGTLGYLLAAALAATLATAPVERMPLLFLPGVACLADSGLTLAWRMARKERWWQPHVQHLYQRLARRLGHPRVTLAYAGWTAAGIGLALMLQGSDAGLTWGLALVFMVVSAMSWAYFHGDRAGAG